MFLIGEIKYWEWQNDTETEVMLIKRIAWSCLEIRMQGKVET
jgi:hypothetical protein